MSMDFRKLFCQLCFLYSIEFLAAGTENHPLINEGNIIDTTKNPNNKFNTNNNIEDIKLFQAPTTEDEWKKIYIQTVSKYGLKAPAMEHNHYRVKFIGEAGAGKTSIIDAMLRDNKATENTKTNAQEKTYECYVYRNQKIGVPFAELTIIDSVGYKDDNDLNNNFVKDMDNVDAVVIVCDISQQNYCGIDKIGQFFPLQTKPSVLFLVGNKIDLDVNNNNRAILYNFSNKNNIQYISVSAKDNFNIKALLINILNQLFSYNKGDHLLPKTTNSDNCCSCCPCYKDKKKDKKKDIKTPQLICVDFKYDKITTNVT